MHKKRRLGSITARANGRHYPQLTVRDPDGAARRISLGGFASRSEAERVLARAVVDLERGAFAPPTRRTLASYLIEDWLPSIARDIRPTTHANYMALVRAYVGPWSIAREKLSDLTELELKRFYNTLAEKGGRGGRPLAPKTVLHVHAMLRRALEDAVSSNLIPRNPAPKRRPRVERTEHVWLRADELAGLLDFARFREPEFYPAFRLAALAGLRRGELAGLRWRDLDVDQFTLTIRRSRTLAGGRVVEGPTKTTGSSSVIKIDSDIPCHSARSGSRVSVCLCRSSCQGVAEPEDEQRIEHMQ